MLQSRLLAVQYITPEEAQELSGLKLVLTAEVPAPYSMAAKAVFELKKVPYIAVRQQGGGTNPELVAWTKHRNAPVAVYNNEAPRAGWLEIVNLAERLGSGPSLIPEDIQQRMLMIGLISELIGENGWLWNLRLLMLGAPGPERAAQAAQKNPMYDDYGYSHDILQKAEEKARLIQNHFVNYAEAALQNSRYLIGEKLSALDIYWAYISQIMQTLPDDECQMPRGLRKSYDYTSEVMGGPNPVLIEQRNYILKEHLSLPMEF